MVGSISSEHYLPATARHLLLSYCLLALIRVATCPTQAIGIDTAITVTDFRGKQLTLPRPAGRIVCLIESALSGLYMLGAEHQVVGVSANIYSDPVHSWYAALDERIQRKELPAPGNWDFVSVESVIALKPDVVLIWSKQTESIAVIEERGIPVFGVFLASKEDVYRELLALGVLTGKEKRAAEIVAYTQREVERIASRAATIPLSRRPGVYFMWAQGVLETSCSNSTVNDLISLAGGRNVCSSIPSEHAIVNLERVLAWNPDVIIMWQNDRKDPQDVVSEPQWRSIKAVRSGRVHEFPEAFLCDLWTLKFQYAVKMLAKWANPDFFADLDLENEKHLMLTNLFGRDFKGL